MRDTPATADTRAAHPDAVPVGIEATAQPSLWARAEGVLFDSAFMRQFGLSLTIAAVAVLVILASFSHPIRSLEDWAADIRIALLNPVAPQHGDVVVVAITEETLAKLGRRSPIDRAFLSQLLQNLQSAEVRAIGLDILVDQPSEEKKDNALFETLQGISVPVVLAWGDVATSDGFMQPWQEAYLRAVSERIDNPNVVWGPANLHVDQDGTVRNLFSVADGGGAALPFANALARVMGGDADSPGPRLAYYGRQWTGKPPFNRIPAHLIDQSNQTVWKFMTRGLKGKAVLIGADLPGTDRYRTPFAADPVRGEPRTAGVFLHAHALAQLIDGRRLEVGSVWLGLLAIAIMMGAGCLLGTTDIGVVHRVLGFAGAIAAFWACAAVIFAYGGGSGDPYSAGPVISVVSPTLAFLAAFAVGVGHARRRHREQKRFIRRVLRHYVPPPVMNELIADPTKLRLGGERREMTFLFTDIAGFTSLSESIDPNVLVTTLNDYLDGMCNLIHAHGGTIDKFVGDAVVAFWGAPTDEPNHAALAVQCALDMDAHAQDFAARKAAEGVNLGITRIGVYTGVATVGNFGGAVRYDYTALGDAVNTAARLESVNKHLRTRICVGGPTAERCQGIAFRPVGELVLKGKQKPVSTFEPVAAEAAPDADRYLEAFDLMRAQKWCEAEAALDALLKAAPDDSMAKFHLDRIRQGERSLEIVMEEK